MSSRPPERFALRVRTGQGQAPAGTCIHCEMVRHQFRFGINAVPWGLADAPAQDAMNDAITGLFNWVTVPFYWGRPLYSFCPPYEPEQGTTNAGRLEALIQWCAEHEIRVKGHPLLFYREPEWLQHRPPDEQERMCWARIEREVSRFAGRVHAWEVVNEPTAWQQTCVASGALAMHRLMEANGPGAVIDRAHGIAAGADPSCELIQNDCVETDDYADICRDALDRGARIDAIGIQHHAIERPATEDQLAALIDRFAALGRPVHITEIMIPSGSQTLRDTFNWTDRPEWVSTPEGEERQARETEQLYRRLFANPAVTAITWSDLSKNRAFP